MAEVSTENSIPQDSASNSNNDMIPAKTTKDNTRCDSSTIAFTQAIQEQEQLKQENNFLGEQPLRKRSSKIKLPLSLQSLDLLSVLGEGRYGTVVLARKKEGGKFFALKVLKKSLIKKRNFAYRVQKERDILVLCESQFLTNLHGAFHNDRCLFFLLDYCPGGDFFNLLQKKGSLTENEAKFYASQLVLTIEYLHSQDILYRDLKPENILIEKNGYLKLGDFGYATQHIDDLEQKAICGTPHYSAPEMITREGHSKAVDWWALGCVIFEMVSGSTPFNDYNQKVLFERIKTSPLNFEVSTRKLSNHLKDLLNQLLNKNQHERLGTVGGAAEIKSHPWFKKIDWDGIYNQTVPAPFVPILKKNTDISNFDATVTAKEVGDFSGESTDSSSDDESEEIYANFFYEKPQGK